MSLYFKRKATSIIVISFLKWFTDYDKNDKCAFVKYDIKEFYPSITEKAADEALQLDKEYIMISKDKINSVKHCRKSTLCHNEELWIKMVLVVTSKTPWVHSTGLNCPNL